MKMVRIIPYLKRIILWIVKYTTFLGAFLFSIGKNKELPLIQDDILLKSASKLAEEIRKRKLKSVQVITAFIKRIEEVDPYLNAVVQNRFSKALDEAKEADDFIESGALTEQQLEKEKPLLGVPFTVKVVFSVKGLRRTAGSLIFKDFVSTEDAVVVSLLRKAGGIVLATTNSAEMGCHLETNNLIHGRTNNPYDTSRTTGGSSGGEVALIAAAGSVIGLGNDISGSVRIPSHYCCLFAHKPSRELVSNSGSIPSPTIISEYMLTPGPICRYAEDLVLMMRLLSPENKEKFSDVNKVDFQKLKIFYHKGIMSDSCITKPDQEIIDALHNAASHFTKTYGSVVQEINIPHLNKGTLISIYLLREGISDVFEYITFGKTKNLNSILEMIKSLFGMSQWTFFVLGGYGLSSIAYPNREEDISYYKNLRSKVIETFENLLDENSVFLFPTFPIAAPLHYATLPFIPNIAYTNIFNYTGMPATQCPMGMNKKGLPIGIQIAGRINNDRLTLACARELEKVFGGWRRPDKVNVTMK